MLKIIVLVFRVSDSLNSPKLQLVIYPAMLFPNQVMSPSFKYPIAACIFLVLVGIAPINAAPQGFLEGHLKILSPTPVQPDENMATETAANYADYPLVILSSDGRREIARVGADAKGNYRVALPPGDYILDVQRHEGGHLRAKPQRFTIVSKQTVRVDMNIETERSRSSSAQSFQPE